MLEIPWNGVKMLLEIPWEGSKKMRFLNRGGADINWNSPFVILFLLLLLFFYYNFCVFLY